MLLAYMDPHAAGPIAVIMMADHHEPHMPGFAALILPEAGAQKDTKLPRVVSIPTQAPQADQQEIIMHESATCGETAQLHKRSVRKNMACMKAKMG
jgi:hypothetical protein